MPQAQRPIDTGVGEKPAKRKYTSKACEACRRRRAKCDGQKPSCSRCLDRAIECRFSAEEDKRRPAPQSYVRLLRTRITILERILRSHGIDVDASVARCMLDDRRPEAVAPVTPQDAPHQSKEASISSEHFEELCVAYERSLTLDESVTFDQDGEMHYFGPSSGRLEFQLSEAPKPLEPHIPLKRVLPLSEEDDEVPYELKSHLVDLFFYWQQPWCQVVDEKLYRESEMNSGRYYSPLLLNCILAVGSRFSDRPEVRLDVNDPNTAGRCFVEKAELQLLSDLKWPSVTTIQSLSLLNTIYVVCMTVGSLYANCILTAQAIGADAAGWLHQGMANRLALDMGLNLDMASLTGSNTMPSDEAELRRQIYWALYCDDKLSASYTGRVCTMLDNQGVVNLPSGFVSPETGAATSKVAIAGMSSTDAALLHCALIKLSHISENMFLALYAPKPSLQASQRTSFLTSCILELKTWVHDLPSALRIDKPSGGLQASPQTYTLHMTYHTTFILLLKPFLVKKSPLKPQPPATSSSASLNGIKAREMCLDAAERICLVAKKYRQAFGSFRKSPVSATHCTLWAALVLIQMGSSGAGSGGVGGDAGLSVRNIHNIELCLQILEELAVSWDIARRICRNLQELYRKLRAGDDAATEMAELSAPQGATGDRGGLQDLSPHLPDDGIGSVHALVGDGGVGDLGANVSLDDAFWAEIGLDLPGDYHGFNMSRA
ncbi:uncharacterized protein K452DRAFT_361105 [Aplosporella prunicola CBS 121167]|uniref:Zn(2)-C6 fungal-type domain-containing protein n=1 Tax=Aplosporella prunicola CBS 121167 TaxID=1176127 RepID=A0A6A6B6M6_9PEZI|nr:uncharacterized protein K452DRAFT_361105 [Aplosporella prunicola CBS 121167]KAF2138905.1 hypothetical protein K452DRAFT_361105 [Aplosporella prunicola CBS 121167]